MKNIITTLWEIDEISKNKTIFSFFINKKENSIKVSVWQDFDKKYSYNIDKTNKNWLIFPDNWSTIKSGRANTKGKIKDLIKKEIKKYLKNNKEIIDWNNFDLQDLNLKSFTKEDLTFLEKNINKIIKRNTKDIVIWYDDWMPDVEKWINDIWLVLWEINKIPWYKNKAILEIDEKDIRKDKTAIQKFWMPRLYRYSKWKYLEDKGKYIIEFDVILRDNFWSQELWKENIIITIT